MASRNRNRNKNQDNPIEISSSTDSEEPVAQSDVDEEEEGSDDSQDEYQPPIKLNDSKTATAKSRSKRKRVEESDEEDDDEQEDQFVELDDSDLEEFQSSNKKKSKSQPVKKSKIPKDRNTKPSSSSHDRKKKTGKGKSKAQNSDDDDLVSDEDQEPSFYHKELAQAQKLDSEEEREDSIRAQEAWAAVKARKEGKPIPPSKLKPPKDPNSNSNSNANGSNALTSWLGLPDEDSIPWPISCPEAQIQDRDSTFIAYCYPLTKMSDLPLILTHLTKKVHPLVPINLLPIQFQSVPANKRGSSHDMHAYSFLVLKRGRDGRDGPEDYALKEGKEDDGEKWSSQKIENIIRQEGASDVVCIVSRWYGGTMLGPIRFTHIENVARAAIKRFIDNETIEPLRQQIQDLDAKILDLRKTLNPPTSESPAKPLKINDYPDLTMEKAEKLMKARNATFSYLEKQLASTSMSKSTSTSTSNPNHAV